MMLKLVKHKISYVDKLQGYVNKEKKNDETVKKIFSS